MGTIQARLWKVITPNFGSLDIYDRFDPSKNKELKNLYYEMCEKFMDTLTDNQKKAFKKLSNLSNAIFSDSQDTGIALGIYIALELQKLLSHPAETLQEASSDCLPVSKMFASDIQALNEYFREHDKQGGVSGD